MPSAKDTKVVSMSLVHVVMSAPVGMRDTRPRLNRGMTNMMSFQVKKHNRKIVAGTVCDPKKRGVR